MDDRQWKLGSFDPAHGWVPVTLADTYCRETERGVDRIAAGPSTGAMNILLSLCEAIDGPFRFVYCLLSGSADHPNGYYSLPNELTFEELKAMICDFEAFFEEDGRHTLWIASPRDKATLIYDEHNLIYAYGPLEAFAEVLAKTDLQLGEVKVPFPHTHHRHDHLEPEMVRLLSAYEWMRREPFG